MSDLISRQAAIDVLAAMQGRCTSKAALIQNSKIWQQIKDLPSAQPEVRTQMSVPDCISRQAAIDAICTWDKFGVDERGRVVRWYEGLEPYVHLRDVVMDIEKLPSAQPEQRWIPCEDVLPCPGARVIVWAKHTELGVETSDILRYHGEKYGWELKDVCTVIAWMPLPEPYREGEQDETDRC